MAHCEMLVTTTGKGIDDLRAKGRSVFLTLDRKKRPLSELRELGPTVLTGCVGGIDTGERVSVGDVDAWVFDDEESAQAAIDKPWLWPDFDPRKK